MTWAYCSRDCFDNIVSLQVFVVSDCWSDRKLWCHRMLASRAAASHPIDSRHVHQSVSPSSLHCHRRENGAQVLFLQLSPVLSE